jgi:hypothetical protein
MYLFVRTRRINPGRVTGAMEWVVRATEQARQITGQTIDAWSAVMSPEVGTVAWTLFAEHLADIEMAGDKLAADAAFMRSVEESDDLFVGTMEDGLASLLTPLPDEPTTANYVAVVQGTAANGRLRDAITSGIEIAEAATRIGGQPTAFAVAASGAYGGVMWFTGSPDIETLESSEAAVNADDGFLTMVDGAATAYAQGVSQTIYRRIV